MKTKFNEKFENLNANFEEWKNPLDQQIKRLWFENIAYDRELQRYRNHLREIIGKTQTENDQTERPDSKQSAVTQRRGSVPIENRRESDLKEVQHYFKDPNK